MNATDIFNVKNSFWHIFDVILFLLLVWRVYRLLKGSIALNIFAGVLLLYTLSWFVSTLEMPIMKIVISQFASIGVIVTVIVLQPEIRRFMMVLGQNTLKGRVNFLNHFMENPEDESGQRTQKINALQEAMLNMAQQRIGAIIIIANDVELMTVLRSGVILNAVISRQLIETIFKRESSLHDGALIVAKGRIRAASCVLPLSDNPNIPQRLGLRHRSAVGVTETMGVVAFIVSEESGEIAFARDGNLKEALTAEQLKQLLIKYFQ